MSSVSNTAILMQRKVWQASGHESNFTDPLVDCKMCKARFRADQIGESECPRKPSKHPGEHHECQLTEARKVQPHVQDLRRPRRRRRPAGLPAPRTAQGIFVNFKNVCDSTRIKVPFGIAQVRQEFSATKSPQAVHLPLAREFEQMEMRVLSATQHQPGMVRQVA